MKLDLDDFPAMFWDVCREACETPQKIPCYTGSREDTIGVSAGSLRGYFYSFRSLCREAAESGHERAQELISAGLEDLVFRISDHNLVVGKKLYFLGATEAMALREELTDD